MIRALGQWQICLPQTSQGSQSSPFPERMEKRWEANVGPPSLGGWLETVVSSWVSICPERRREQVWEDSQWCLPWVYISKINSSPLSVYLSSPLLHHLCTTRWSHHQRPHQTGITVSALASLNPFTAQSVVVVKLTSNRGVFLPSTQQLLPISLWVKHMGWLCYFLSSTPTHRVDHLAPTWPAGSSPPGDWGPSAQRFFLQCPQRLPLTFIWFTCSSWRHLDSPSRVKLQLFCHLTLPSLLPVLRSSSASSNISRILLIHLVFSSPTPLPPQLQKVNSGQ